MKRYSRRTIVLLLTAFLAIQLHTVTWAQLTLETGAIGEVFFTWQGELSDAGARSHALSRTNAFRGAFDGGWLQSVEILEVTELNTNQTLPFSYVIPTGSARSMPDLRDVVWYYPNPIPSGGKVRLLIRGRLASSAVFSGDETIVEFSYFSNDEVLFILPIGYSVTYSSNPIIIYEKDSRTVASFPRSGSVIALTAKDARKLDDALAPVISRDSNAVVTASDLGVTVVPVTDEAVLEYARNRVNGGITSPVLIDAIASHFRIRSSDADFVVPGRTVIWSINDIIVDGVGGFEEISRQLAIGAEANVNVMTLNEEGRATGSRTVRILAVEKP